MVCTDIVLYVHVVGIRTPLKTDIFRQTWAESFRRTLLAGCRPPTPFLYV
jgi:hypothetical protein